MVRMASAWLIDMWRVSHFENWTPAGFLLETFQWSPSKGL